MMKTVLLLTTVYDKIFFDSVYKYIERKETVQKIGLVLSGGFAKGAYQLGVLKAVQELVNCDNIEMISASSVGVLNAYAFANRRLGTAERIWNEMNFKSTSAFIRKVLQGNYLDECLSRIPINEEFKKTEFYATLLNTTQRKVDYINLSRHISDNVRRFVRASVALPPFNRPMHILNNSYLDGALVDNIPISPFVRRDFDCIICIYFDDYNYNFENIELNKKTIKINQQSNIFIKNTLQFKHEYIGRMIEDGYRYGRTVLSQFFSDGELVPEYEKKIEAFNIKNGKLKWYVTCDVVAREFNKVAKRFLDKKPRHQNNPFNKI